MEIHRAAEVHIYDVVSDDTSIEGRVVLYQGLDVGTQDYVREYNELKERTYQELDLKRREKEHHYQRAHTYRERKECGRRDQLIVVYCVCMCVIMRVMRIQIYYKTRC